MINTSRMFATPNDKCRGSMHEICCTLCGGFCKWETRVSHSMAAKAQSQESLRRAGEGGTL